MKRTKPAYIHVYKWPFKFIAYDASHVEMLRSTNAQSLRSYKRHGVPIHEMDR